MAGSGDRSWRRICAIVRSERRPCHLCGKPIDYTLPYRDPITRRINRYSFTGDHLVPTNHHGTNTYANCGAAHQTCNSARHDDVLVAELHSERW